MNPSPILISTPIYIAGHNGMVGSAVWRRLKTVGYSNLIGRRSKELDLRKQADVMSFFEEYRPKVVIDAAARVGGIMANRDYPYSFLMDNLQIQDNLIHACMETGVEKFVFLGSSCIYPREAPQPIKEEYLLSGPLEPTNQWYAIAKIAGVKAIEAIRQQSGKDYVALMPTNLYGPNDNFDLKTSHVLPALLRKFHGAKQAGHKPVSLWGTGNPRREFMHVDDLATAVQFALEHQLPDPLYNVGTGTDLTIRELAGIIQEMVGHMGEILWDTDKPDGSPRKLLDVSKLNGLGWEARISLNQGLKETFAWYLQQEGAVKEVRL